MSESTLPGIVRLTQQSDDCDQDCDCYDCLDVCDDSDDSGTTK